MILTDEDYKAIENNSGFKRCFNGDAFQKIVEATESAVLEKLRQQEPAYWLLDGVLYEVEQWNLPPGDGPIQGQTPLYAAPVAAAAPDVQKGGE